MGYLTIMVFLLVAGLLLFFLPDTNMLDAGYATMDSFFEFAPLLLLILIPAITMRSFSDEYKAGTYELIKTLPVTSTSMVAGKFLASMSFVLVSLSGSLIYVFSMSYLSLDGLDIGALIGSYVGLILLSAVYSAIGVYISSLFTNALTSFMLTAFACFMIYYVFSFFNVISIAQVNVGYFISIAGVKYHYENISKGYIEWSDVVYFLSVTGLFIYETSVHLRNQRN